MNVRVTSPFNDLYLLRDLNNNHRPVSYAGTHSALKWHTPRLEETNKTSWALAVERAMRRQREGGRGRERGTEEVRFTLRQRLEILPTFFRLTRSHGESESRRCSLHGGVRATVRVLLCAVRRCLWRTLGKSLWYSRGHCASFSSKTDAIFMFIADIFMKMNLKSTESVQFHQLH